MSIMFVQKLKDYHFIWKIWCCSSINRHEIEISNNMQKRNNLNLPAFDGKNSDETHCFQEDTKL